MELLGYFHANMAMEVRCVFWCYHWYIHLDKTPRIQVSSLQVYDHQRPIIYRGTLKGGKVRVTLAVGSRDSSALPEKSYP